MSEKYFYYSSERNSVMQLPAEDPYLPCLCFLMQDLRRCVAFNSLLISVPRGHYHY